jgi:hypothetical protein
MEYINLLNYLDKPELIQHIDNEGVIALHHFPKNSPDKEVLVVFEETEPLYYHKDGRHKEGVDRMFILKPKPKRTITGWRRGIIYPSGRFDPQPLFCPTRDDFIRNYASNCTLFGPWESETVEVEEES